MQASLEFELSEETLDWLYKSKEETKINEFEILLLEWFSIDKLCELKQ